MENGNVFQNGKEMRRLGIQGKLLKPYEETVYQRIFAGRRDLKLLDIGCNDGSKMAERFSGENISKVIGLEYNEALIQKARSVCKDGRFAFYQCDVEKTDFAGRLWDIMSEHGISKFDGINISLVLSHLQNPEALLELLRSFLVPEGALIIIEADDTLGKLCPDAENLCDDFLEILDLDPLSGDRKCCGRLRAMLEKCGYQNIMEIPVPISANGADAERKKDIFDTFFSYLPEDIEILLQQEPDHTEYADCQNWLEENYDSLREQILSETSDISMGFRIFTCMGASFSFTPLTAERLDEAVELCGRCVGENLYAKEYLAGILEKEEHHFCLLTEQDGKIAGYIYYYCADLQEAAELSKLPKERLAEVFGGCDPAIGVLRSIGVAEKYRNRGLSRLLLRFYVNQLKETIGADVMFGVFWKPKGNVPMQHALEEAGFSYLEDVHKIWYDNDDLICPYCKGRCQCDAAVYYKVLREGVPL